MTVVQVNYRFDDRISDPDALLDRYSTLTGWSQALLHSGAARVTAVQRFSRDAVVSRSGIQYVFRAGSARRTHRAVADTCSDIVHVNGLDSPWWTLALRRRLSSSTRLVVQDHKTAVPEERGPRAGRGTRRALRRLAMRAPDGFFFTAAALADPWRDAGLIGDCQRVYEVLESSTTLRPIDRPDARRLSGVSGSPAVLWVGRLHPDKDPLTMLEGFDRALPEIPGAMLTMVYGGDDLLPEVRRRIGASRGLVDRVRLVGAVPHESMPAFYSAADLFVLASLREGSGYALIEACACGATPVVTSIPTFRAITSNGVAGALWNAGDPHSFARALVAASRRDRSRERAQTLAHFAKSLGWPVVGRQAMTAYRDLLRPAGSS